VSATPSYFPFVAWSKSELSLVGVWPTVGMWPGRPVILSDVVVFQDDIGALESEFSRFSSN
jgi:hypothetical protein